jgi:hypothetical protein
MADDEFKRRLVRVEELYRELTALREGSTGGAGSGKEALVLAELQLDNAWRELYEFMELPLAPEGGTAEQRA